MISGALQVAVDDINYNTSLLPNYKLDYIFNNTCGDEMRSNFCIIIVFEILVK